MTLIRYSMAVALGFILVACSPPPVENTYRDKSYFRGGLDVPVSFLVSEWAGKPKIMASGWLIDGSNGVLFSAKHFSDVFMGDMVELGRSECKAFINNRVYTCLIIQVPPLRDAVLLKLQSPFGLADLPPAYRIATEKVKVGERLFVQGFHPHALDVMESNKEEGFRDFLIPILRDFYEERTAEPKNQREIVFDSLGVVVASLNEKIRVEEQNHEPLGNLKYEVNDYFRVTTDRNHKFSFGGLSGGVVVRISGEYTEAVGIITAERVLNLDNDGDLEDEKGFGIYNTLLVTPIHTVKDLSDFAIKLK